MFIRVTALVNWSDKNKFMWSYPKRHMVILNGRLTLFKRKRDQLEYTAPTGFRFLDEPMFCFSTLNANTNPNPNSNCRPGHPTLAANTVAKPAWAPTLAANTVAKPAWAPTLAINRVSGQGRCQGRLCHGVSGQGRMPRLTVRVRVRVSI